MRYVSSYQQVERRSSAVLTDHSAPNFFNASLVIRVPFQPIRCVCVSACAELFGVVFEAYSFAVMYGVISACI